MVARQGLKSEHIPRTVNSSNHSHDVRSEPEPALGQALQLALDVTGAERVFLLRGRSRNRGLEPVVEACRTRRDDGSRRPSRTLAVAALERREPFITTDALVDRRIATCASVRDLDLRLVLTAPLPSRTDDRRALVLDGRCVNRPRTESGLLDVARRLAILIDALPGVERSRVGVEHRTAQCVGDSMVIRRMLEWIGRAAATSLAVLVRGETGSGKEGVAHTIHRTSRRRDGPFVACNCTALTETLLDAELFGSVRGAYTGADRDRRGLFESADQGTLLLDEVGDMPLAMQAKLLRALELGHVRPVGSDEERTVDVRVVAATNRDLLDLVGRGLFREDLYHRLAILEVHVPPLRERLEDLPLLVRSLAPRLEREIGYPLPPVGDEVIERLGLRDWPGNVRELHAVLARAMLRAGGAPLEPRHLGVPRLAPAGSAVRAGGQETEMIRDALVAAGGSVGVAAAKIGWTRQKLYRRIKALSLERSG